MTKKQHDIIVATINYDDDLSGSTRKHFITKEETRSADIAAAWHKLATDFVDGPRRVAQSLLGLGKPHP
jgi:hypothetical protein